jgi:hypothetical protein
MRFGSARPLPLLGCRSRSRNVGSEAFTCEEASSERIRTSSPSTPDSLNQTCRFFEGIASPDTNNTLAANMSDYGGDDEPMDYAMGECASPSRTSVARVWRLTLSQGERRQPH